MLPFETFLLIVLPIVVVVLILVLGVRKLFRSPIGPEETRWCQADKNYPKWKLEDGKLTIVYKKQERIYSLDRVKELRWNGVQVTGRGKIGVANVYLMDGMHFMLTYHYDHRDRGFAALQELQSRLAAEE
ncbi:MAG: hypothetical protein IJC68_00470 [Firmicutes bacterium]|nr:hypothetical protein [Bacillota bacterium]